MKFRNITARHWRASLAIFIGIALLLLAVPRNSQASTDFGYNVAARYQVTSDANTRVEEVYTVTNNSSQQYSDKYRWPKLSSYFGAIKYYGVCAGLGKINTCPAKSGGAQY